MRGHQPSRRLSDLTPEDLTAIVEDCGARPFRARQLGEWMYRRGVFDLERMHNLPASLRRELAARLDVPPMTVAAAQQSDDGTEKLLFRLADGRSVESVLIPSRRRTTVCLSSQVGCAVGCRFCASGVGGGKRNLSRGEILEQFMHMRSRGEAGGRPVTNLVMMGMGEPMFNFNNVLSALGTINSPAGPGLGARRITVSTVGIRSGVERFTRARTQYTLAFSLHAPDDDLRRRIVPLRSAMTVAEIRDAARAYLAHTGREVTFEYVLLRDVNDAESHARELARVMHGIQASVNLIPYNPVAELPYARPSDDRIDAFERTLRQRGLKVSVRRRKGSDIDAACGQLAMKSLQ